MPALQTTPQVQITSTQFECGPAAPPLPSDEELLQWSDRRLLDEYAKAWKWGDRCSTLLKDNKIYFEDALRIRLASPKPPVAK